MMPSASHPTLTSILNAPAPRLRDPIVVPFEDLFLDPNNPRISPVDPPGYADPSAICAPDVQARLEQRLRDVYDVDGLASTIVEQGWTPLDGILVYPIEWEDRLRYVVLEGNTRTCTLRTLRERAGRRKTPVRSGPDRLGAVLKATERLQVIPVAADSLEELAAVLPRILGVRHVAGPKTWTPNAVARFILASYTRAFRAEHPANLELEMDERLAEEVARTVSLTKNEARKKIGAAHAFDLFKSNYESKLPSGEVFEDGDVYAFDIIVRSPFLCAQFGYDPLRMKLSAEGEAALFEWAFALPRTKRAEDNPNILYRHEALKVWDQMRRYDEKHHTHFAANFAVSDPGSAPSFHEIEADWRQHKVHGGDTKLLERLIREVGKISADQLLDKPDFVHEQLTELHARITRLMEMLSRARKKSAS